VQAAWVRRDLPVGLRPCTAAYAIVRSGGGRFLRSVNSLFLLGLAIPQQAVVIPVYLIIIRACGVPECRTSC
jgi:raffinose/stachyose/melibiose transport system permease protein